MITSNAMSVAVRNDAELVGESLAGNRDAFGQIVARYQSLICSLAYSATGSLSQSEDLAQDTFVAAWKQLADLREPAKLRAWLCGIARNLIHNALRRQRREPSHDAETLEAIAEPEALEPLPVEHAVSREEEAILWRSLERIPEIYREPLVLFYREHQSVTAVAQNLDLSEDAVKQRLSRGRRLLHEQVLAFVESALERSAPGKNFTLGVLAVLPAVVTSAKAASVGVAVAKGGTAAKSLFSLSALAGSLSVPVAILFSWKTLVDDSKSPRERKFTARMARCQVAFFVVSLVAAVFCIVLCLPAHPWIAAAAFALLILANAINGVMVMPYIVRRRMEIGLEEGTLADTMEAAMWDKIDRAFPQPGDGREAGALVKTMPDGLGEAARRIAVRRTIKLTIPFLIMFGGMGIVLPWKQHWLKCAALMAAYALLIFWFIRRTHRQLSFRTQPRPFRGPAFMRNPFIGLSVILFGTMLLAAVGGCLLPLFLNPGATKWASCLAALRPLALAFLLAVLAYAALVALIFLARRKIVPKWKWLAGLFDQPFLQQFQTLTGGPDAVTEMTYAPLFQQINLGPDRRAKLKDLVLKRTMVGVRAGMSLMNWRLDAAKRADLTREMKSQTDGFNEQIKEFLGAENYAAFQQFEKTIPDRMMLDQFNRRLAGTAAALNPDLQARLLQALTDAREQYPWTTELSRRNWGTGDFAAQFTEDNLDTFAREAEQFDWQFLTRAQQLLSLEQLAAFEKVQERRRKSQIAQYKMGARLLRFKKSGS
jgi:RNA polymerase sigma factor (sigma-70 family)